MNALIRVELTRYRTRRVIVLLAVAAAVLTALVAFKTAWDTRPPSADELRTANAAAEADGSRSDVKQQVTECENDPARYLGPEGTADQCSPALQESPTNYLPRETLDLTGTLKGNGIGIALLVVALLIIAGSTFAGADWKSGSIRNQVLFEPRRTRVWGAKAIATGIGTGVTALVVLGGFWLAIVLVAADRGVPHGSEVITDIVWHVLRATALAVGAGVGACALTTLLRSSTATLSLLFVYSIGGELMTYLLPINGVSRWTLTNNVFGWLETRLEFYDTAHCDTTKACNQAIHISHLDAGLYLLAALAIAGVVSWATFRRRDI